MGNVVSVRFAEIKQVLNRATGSECATSQLVICLLVDWSMQNFHEKVAWDLLLSQEMSLVQFEVEWREGVFV